LLLLNTNYADPFFLFTIFPAEKTNAFLGTECLTVVETDNDTPYYLNLHCGGILRCVAWQSALRCSPERVRPKTPNQ